MSARGGRCEDNARVMRMNDDIKETIRFVLEDDSEVMSAALEGDLDEENKRMNQELIQKHEAILAKLDRDEMTSQENLQLIRDANEIHLNDSDDLNGNHGEAVELVRWLDNMAGLDKEEAMQILEQWLDRDARTPARVYRALHTLWEEATPNGVAGKPAFNDEGRCLKCGSKLAFADVTDTVVFVGDEIVKRYDGDITNRNCVRCNHPEQYPDYEDYDEDDGSPQETGNRHQSGAAERR